MMEALEADTEERDAGQAAAPKSANTRLQEAEERLKAGLFASIKVFSTLLDMRGGQLAGHARRVAELARKIAVAMELDERQTQDIFVAGLLHEIGKLGFSDELLAMPVAMMTGPHLPQYRSHPVLAAQLLMPLPDLHAAATSIVGQLERFDGTGFPRRLSAEAIPLGARILGLASDYDSLQTGALAHRALNADEARTVIQHGSGKRYDPKVVSAFLAVLGPVEPETRKPASKREKTISSGELLPGMVLSRDLMASNGLPMLSAEQVLDDRLIQKILALEKPGGTPQNVFVYAG